MAEDDMLLNFSIDDASLKPKSVFKGGKWRDRVRATKTSGGRQRMVERKEPTANGGSASKEAEVFGDPNQSEQRPSKRQKTAQTDGPSRGNEQRIQVPKEVVSSLFTYNPISKFKLTPNVEEDQQAKPTNAPLLDGLDTFLSLGLSTSLAIFVRDKLKITAPTMIQKSTIPQLLKDDSDVFMQAETGSGKTLAYLLPIVQRIMNQSKVQKATGNEEGSRIHRDSGLFAIVLAPTRELCKQISVVLESLLRCAPWIVCGTVTGGEKKKSEKARLRKGLNVLVATPGRLADHLANTKVLDVSSIRWLVLDEADRLMELGFEVQIKEILSELQRRFNSDAQHAHGSPLRRTTILCSATMKMNVQRLGSMSLRDAVHLKANTLGAEANGNLEISHEQIFAAPAQLKQSCLIVPAKQRLVTLAALLKHNFARKGSVMKAIVFMSCADSVDFHFSVFGRQPQPTDVTERSYEEPALTRKPDLPTRALAPFLTSSTNPELTLYKLHGSLTQFLRTSTLASFTRSPNPSILLCTDVASRGLDLPTLDLVIEYDPAFSAEDRLHRIGRTARAGQDGRAIVFLQPGPEEGYLEILERGCGEVASKRLARKTADEMLRRGFAPSAPETDAAKTAWEEAATEWQLEAERWVAQDKRAADMARKAYVSHVRAYATHVAAERKFFDVKELHLGHLAKAFALREKPGSIGRGGGKATTNARHGSERASRGGWKQRRQQHDDDRDDRNDGERPGKSVGMEDAAVKMRRAMKARASAADEFNIG